MPPAIQPSRARSFTVRSLLPDHPAVWGWLGLFLSLLCLFLKLGSADPSALNVWISSDTLYPVNVTTDILRDGYSLSGWRFSIAPCWAPDVFLTGFFWVVTRNPIAATLLAGFIQPALIVGAFFLIRKAIGLGSAVLQNVFLLAVSAWIALYVAARPGLTYPDFYRFFIPQSHVGSLIMSLTALALALSCVRESYARSAIPRSIVIAYGAVCLFAGMSNLLFLPQMLLPFTLAVALVAFFDIVPLRNSWRPILVGWPAAILGAILNRVLFHTTAVSAQSQISREAAITAMDVFTRGAVDRLLALETLHLFAVAWIAVCTAVVTLTLRTLAQQRSAAVGLPQRLLCLFCSCWLLSDLISAGAIIVGGSNGLTVFKDYNWTTHYLQSVFFVPLFGLPMLLSWLIYEYSSTAVSRGVALAVAALVLVVPAVSLASAHRPAIEITSYRPPLVRFLDNLASQRRLNYGLAGYWQARLITLLSLKGLRAYAVDGSINPLLWVDNADWYTEQLEDRGKKPPIDFVVLDDPGYKLTRESAVHVFGEPSQEVSYQGTRVLIYAGGAKNAVPSPVALLATDDTPFTRFAEQITSPVKSLSVHPGQTISIPVTIKDTSGELWASAGKYPVTLSYKWLAGGQMLSIEGARTLLPRPVIPGETISFDARVVAPQEGTSLILRLSLVQEGVAWFVTQGAAPLDIPAEFK